MLPGASVVRLHHYNPVIDGRISKLPGELLVFQRFLHLQHFLLDSVPRDGQYVGVRTAYRPQQVNDRRHDSGKLQQGPRVDAEAAAGRAVSLSHFDQIWEPSLFISSRLRTRQEPRLPARMKRPWQQETLRNWTMQWSPFGTPVCLSFR